MLTTFNGPECIVQRQLEAYNARDIEGILATYWYDAQHFEHPARLIASGVAELREVFLTRFKEPNLHALLLNRIVVGDFVIDHERVTRTFPGGSGTIEITAIYQVLTGKIKTAWFILGPRS